MKPVKVVTRVSGTSPELLADLSILDPRERAERLRALAQVGLAFLGSHGAGASLASIPAAPVPAPAAPKEEKRKLLGRLGSSWDREE